MRGWSLLIAILLTMVPELARAASTINVGDHFLAPQTANQSILLSVSGDDLINSVNLFMTIDSGVGPAPLVTAVDYVETLGLIFEPTDNIGNAVYPGPHNLPGLTPATGTQVVTPGVTVLANGVLAIVTFDTTDVPPGEYTWSLTGHVFYGDSDLGTDANELPILPVITNGTLTVVPEPSSLALALAAAAAGMAAACIRLRSRARVHS